MSTNPVIASAQRSVLLQSDSIAQLAPLINEDFAKAVDCIVQAAGRLVISGIGKSAIIAQKIVATMNSTGTPAIFMHAADAIHGDLGMVQADDVILLISKSGDSPEIKVLVPLIKSFGNPLIGMVGNVHSFLAQQSNYLINSTVSQEACPNNLAPTNSTTAQLVMGDALAICLMEKTGFGTSDFARVHPGGALGKKLYLRAGDLIGTNDRPQVAPDATIAEVIVEITKKRLGATAVLTADGTVGGIITDGDLRRMLEKGGSFEQLRAKDIMTIGPKMVASDLLATEALELMKTNDISQLLVTNQAAYMGILHIHDLVREGII